MIDEKPFEPETLNLRGLICPLPVLKLRRKLSELHSGDSISLIATDPGVEKDVPAFCLRDGHRILHSEKRGEEYHFTVKKARD